jgi:hypothetical protein
VANTYALLNELRFASAFGNCGIFGSPCGSSALESHDRPFDLAYCITSKTSSDDVTDDGLSLIAGELSIASTDGVRKMLRSCQKTATPREAVEHETFRLRTFSCTSLAGPKQSRIDRLAKMLAREIEIHWLENADPAEWRRLDSARHDPVVEVRQNCPNGMAEQTPRAAAPPKSSTETWRQRLGEFASTRIAHEVVSRICRRSTLNSAYRKNLCSLTNPERFVEIVSQAIPSISMLAASNVAGSPSDEEENLVHLLSTHGHHILAKVIDEFESPRPEAQLDALGIDRMITTECAAVVKEWLERHSADEISGSREAMQIDMRQALARASVDLLQCGYDRRMLIVVPRNHSDDDAVDSMKEARPSATVVPSEVDDIFIYCEGSGISPSSFARGLERVYPGIAEAASRFYTRTDIDWSAGIK